MEQYQIVKADSSYKDFVINLNMENMPAVGGLDEDSFDKFIKYSDYFKPLFSKWNYVEKKNDEEIIKQILEDGIHILIDLQGHSAKNRLTVFMHEAAPVQATWLGQGSTGIPEIKYFIGNSYINPKLEDQNYVEKVLRLPDVSQCFTIPEFDIKIEELQKLKKILLYFQYKIFPADIFFLPYIIYLYS